MNDEKMIIEEARLRLCKLGAAFEANNLLSAVNRTIEVVEQYRLNESKRLESGGGSGATSCCEGREAGKQDLRKGEAGRTCPVAPGEAEAVATYCCDVAAANLQYAKDHAKRGMKQLAAYYAGISAAWESAAIVFGYANQVPKPDSEARNERSGLRNPTGQAQR